MHSKLIKNYACIVNYNAIFKPCKSILFKI